MSGEYLRQGGDLVAHYRVRRLLGSGMEGNVYLVNDMRDGALRTLKILRGRNMEADAGHTAAYYCKLAQVSSLKRFREWGVLTGQRGVGARPWLAFDYIVGETLARRIEERRIADPLRVLMAVCAALAPIHRRGFAIGDFDRERNILIERGTGLIRFCDLDAGGPTEPAPRQEDDMQELLRLARRMWRIKGMSPRRDVCAALASSTSALQAGQRLTRLMHAQSQPHAP
jgi:serine/threonine protein kinase